MSTIRDLLARGCVFAIRKLYVKPRLVGGDYNSDWIDITDYVISWGVITESYGDIVFLTEYMIDASDIVLDNSRRDFNDEKDPNSFFYHKSRIGSKFKLTVSYIDDDHTEVSVSTLYSYIYKNPSNDNENKISITHAPYIKIFQLYPASGIDTSEGTTAELVERLVQKTKNGTRIFDKLFEGSDDATKYKINPNGVSVTTITNPVIDEGNSIWDKIQDYAMYDDFIAYVDEDGAFVFTSKDETDTVQFTLNGAGASTEYDGVNIVSLTELDGLVNFWPRIVIEYGVDGNKVSSSSDWTPGDGSDIDIYGEQTLEPNRVFSELSQSEAQIISDNKHATYGTSVKKEYLAETIVPHLKLNDLIKLNYFGEVTRKQAFTIGLSSIYGTDPIGNVQGNYEINNESMKVIKKTSNLDKFLYEYHLMEV